VIDVKVNIAIIVFAVIVLTSLRTVAGSSDAPGKKIFVPIVQSAEKPPPAPTPVPAPTQPPQSPVAQQVIALVNRERAANGLPPVAFNAKVNAAAQAHSSDMARNNFFSHTGSNGSSFGARLTAAGYRWTYWSENIAAGQTSPDEVVRGWMDSPGHRANILDRRAKDAGVGFVDQSGSEWGTYWTLDFAAP
jgi:uncharacterized protein YkwD